MDQQHLYKIKPSLKNPSQNQKNNQRKSRNKLIDDQRSIEVEENVSNSISRQLEKRQAMLQLLMERLEKKKAVSKNKTKPTRFYSVVRSGQFPPLPLIISKKHSSNLINTKKDERSIKPNEQFLLPENKTYDFNFIHSTARKEGIFYCPFTPISADKTSPQKTVKSNKKQLKENVKFTPKTVINRKLLSPDTKKLSTMEKSNKDTLYLHSHMLYDEVERFEDIIRYWRLNQFNVSKIIVDQHIADCKLLRTGILAGFDSFINNLNAEDRGARDFSSELEEKWSEIESQINELVKNDRLMRQKRERCNNIGTVAAIVEGIKGSPMPLKTNIDLLNDDSISIRGSEK